MADTKHDTKPVPELTVKQVALALYGLDTPTYVKRVQRLIISGQIAHKKLPGSTGAYLIEPGALRDYQKAQAQHDKKRRQSTSD
jgi:hypothetical protein